MNMPNTVLILLIVSLAKHSSSESTTGRPVIVGIPHSLFQKFVKVENDTFSGFSIEVFKEAWKLANISSPQKFELFNGTYDELVLKVSRKELDAAVGDVQILAHRLRTVDFTVPYLASGIAIVVPQKHAKFKMTWILDVFTREMWLIIVAIHISISLVTALIELGEKKDPFQCSKLFRLWAAMLSFTEREPLESDVGRYIRAMWKGVIAILVACYYANLTSSLTVSKMAPLIPPDISSATVGCNKNSFICEQYLHDVLRVDRRNIRKINSTSQYIDAFNSMEIQAAYFIEPHARVFLKMYCNQFMVWGIPNHLTGLAFVFPKGSPFTSNMSVAISELMENGRMRKLEKQIDSVNCKASSKEDERKIESSQFFVLLLISMIGLTLGSMVVVGRIISKYINCKKALL